MNDRRGVDVEGIKAELQNKKASYENEEVGEAGNV